MKKKVDYITPLLLIATISFVCTGIYLIKTISDKGSECLVRPLEEGVMKFERDTGSELVCSCLPSNPRYASFTVSKDGIKPLNVYIPSRYNQNLSNFTIEVVR